MDDECWHCGQHVLGLFLWNQRLGQIAGEKNEDKVKYYHNYTDSLKADENFQPSVEYTPTIYARFTNWSPTVMREVTEFCKACNIDPLNIREEAIKMGILRKETIDESVELTEGERIYVNS